MKKIIVLTAILSIGALSSCGTANYYSSNYEDGIYYTPDKSFTSAQIKDEKELANLSRATKNRNMYGSLTDTIFLSKDNNHAEIAHIPNSSYVVLLDGESYEQRLNKFNDSTYAFTIDFALEDPYAFNSWNNPWWGGRYGRYSNSWYGWGSPYFGMSYGFGHGWGPSFGFGWGGGYGPGWGGGWYNPWYSGWYGYPGHHYPPMHYPSYGIPRKDVYYGKRNSFNRGRGNMASNVRSGGSRPSSLNQIRGTSSTGRRPVSSVNTSSGRRGVYSRNNTAIYSPTTKPAGSGNNYANTSTGSKYRRSANTVSRSTATNNKSASTYNRNTSNRSSNSQATYTNRSSNTSNRSSYSSSSTNRSSSSGSSSRSSSSGSSTRSSGGSRR